VNSVSPFYTHITQVKQIDTEEKAPAFGLSTDERRLHLSQQIEKATYIEKKKKTPRCSSG
jgi:hypothetical protein